MGQIDRRGRIAAYRDRLGKDRSAGQSRRSIASALECDLVTAERDRQSRRAVGTALGREKESSAPRSLFEQ
jgi:hypothetical protein